MKFDERLSLIFFIAGLCFVSFVLGGAALYYRFDWAQPMVEALDAGKSWYKRSNTLERKKADKEDENDIDEIEAEYSVSDDVPETGRVSKGHQSAFEGYTLVSRGSSSVVQLIDMDGKPVHNWMVPFSKAWPKPSHINNRGVNLRVSVGDTYALPNGDLLVQYSGSGDTPYGYGIAKYNKDSEVLWTYDGNAHHDFYVSPASGRIYALVHNFVRKPIEGIEGLEFPILNDYIAILSPDGKKLERFSILEAFVDTPYAGAFASAIGKKWDPVHANTVAVLEKDIAAKFPMFKTGSFLVSLRNTNMIAVIDPDTKKVVWAWDGPWKWQHAATFLSNGNILLLDNASVTIRDEPQSRILILDPLRKQIVWSYTGDPNNSFYTFAWGRLQHLPNRNILAVEAAAGRIKEITPDGEVVWTYEIPKRKDGRNNAISSARRYKKEEMPFLAESVPAAPDNKKKE